MPILYHISRGFGQIEVPPVKRAVTLIRGWCILRPFYGIGVMMVGPSKNRKAPEPSRTRTNLDKVMIALGVFLIILFLAVGYLSLTGSENKRGSKIRGPVKDPQRQGFYREDRMPFRFQASDSSMPAWSLWSGGGAPTVLPARERIVWVELLMPWKA